MNETSRAALRRVALALIAQAVRDYLDPREVGGDPTPAWSAQADARRFLRGAAAGKGHWAWWYEVVFGVAGLDPAYLYRLVELRKEARRTQAGGAQEFEQLTLFEYIPKVEVM